MITLSLYVTGVRQQHGRKYLVRWEVIHSCEVGLGHPLGRSSHLGYFRPAVSHSIGEFH